MEVVYAEGVDGARAARGMAVVIDVLRAFTVSAYALAGGARECRLVATVERALELQRAIPGALVSAEVEGFPVAGIPISNSPTLISKAQVAGRILIQRTTSGVQSALAARACDQIVAASLVVASATVDLIRSRRPRVVTLIATGAPLGHQEDQACAALLEALLLGRPVPPLDELLAPLRATGRYARLRAGLHPGFPASDLDLALAVDTFDFAMPIEPHGVGDLRLLPAPAHGSR